MVHYDYGHQTLRVKLLMSSFVLYQKEIVSRTSSESMRNPRILFSNKVYVRGLKLEQTLPMKDTRLSHGETIT